MTQHNCKKCQVLLNETNFNIKCKKSYKCRACASEESKINRANIRLAVLVEYGGKCACCNEEKIEFLTIDHIDGTGAEHRKSIGKSSDSFYRWLRDHSYPKDNYQILCFNCNCAKHIYGVCPHKHS